MVNTLPLRFMVALLCVAGSLAFLSYFLLKFWQSSKDFDALLTPRSVAAHFVCC